MRIRRRDFLHAAGAATAALVLPACGDEDEPGPIERQIARSSIGLDYASYYAPVQDVHRLVLERARRRGARVTFSHDEAGAAAQRRTLEAWIGARGGFRALVVAPFERGSVEPVAGQALEDGIAVVSYLVPLRNETTGISVNPRVAGSLLADEAAAWAAGRPASAILVRPPEKPATADQFAVLAPEVERTLLRRLRGRAPGIEAVAATQAQSVDDAQAAVARALADYPAASVVLGWNDSTAVGAAAALRAAGREQRAFAGGVAMAGVAGKENLEALDDDAVAIAFVAPRLRELAGKLVDVPLALLRDRSPVSGEVVPVALKASSSQLADYRSDYTL